MEVDLLGQLLAGRDARARGWPRLGALEAALQSEGWKGTTLPVQLWYQVCGFVSGSWQDWARLATVRRVRVPRLLEAALSDYFKKQRCTDLSKSSKTALVAVNER